MKLILLLVLTSCAHNTKESAKELINKKEISKGSVLDLVRASYQKGCVDGIQHEYPLKTHGRIFKQCLEKAKNHEKEISDILK
jgi:hypothetical protein